MKNIALFLMAFLLSTLAFAQCQILYNGSPMVSGVSFCMNELPIQLETDVEITDDCFFIGAGAFPDGFFNPLVPGSHVISIGGGGGCESCSVVIVAVAVSPPAEILSVINDYICTDDDTIHLSGNYGAGPGTTAGFTLNGEFLNVDYLLPSELGVGSYTLQYDYVDASTTGCVSSAIADFSIYPLPNMNFEGLNAIYCYGDAVTAELISLSFPLGTSDFDGPGITGANIFDPNLAGIGSHEITHSYDPGFTGQGCPNELTVTVEVVASLLPDFMIIGNACYTDIDSIFYTGDPLIDAAQYDWDVSDGTITSNGGDTIVVAWSSPGIKDIALSVSNVSCDMPIISETIEKIGVEVSTIEDQVIGEFTQVTLETSVTSNSNDLTFSWSPSTNLSCTNCLSPTAIPIESTTYTITASDINGCVAVDSVHLAIIPNRNIFIPNVFTPNDDGNNDLFRIKGAAIESMTMSIYDRWGSKLFETTDIENGWNGTYKGNAVNSGVYIYTIQVNFLDSFSDTYTGNVTILK